MDRIDIIDRLAEKAKRTATPPVSIKGKIDYTSLDMAFRKKRTLMYLAIGSAIAAAAVLILLVNTPAGSGETAAEGMADMHNFFSYFYPSF